MAILTLLLSLFAPVPAAPVAEAPKGLPPLILAAQVDKDGALVSTRTETVYVPVVRTEMVNVNGKLVQRTVVTTMTEQRQVTRKWNLAKAMITDGSGKKIDKEALAKRLAKPAAVVVSADGRAIDPGYLKLFQKDAILIVAPTPAPKRVPAPFPKNVPAPKGSGTGAR